MVKLNGLSMWQAEPKLGENPSFFLYFNVSAFSALKFESGYSYPYTFDIGKKTLTFTHKIFLFYPLTPTPLYGIMGARLLALYRGKALKH